jgi:putative membrane protein insertion efficiency factor
VPIGSHRPFGRESLKRRLTVGQQLALGLLTAYKGILSPHFTGSCRFLPSCSDYARQAIVEHGVIRGSWLATRRLARCHPFGQHGFDPVPPRPRGL